MTKKGWLPPLSIDLFANGQQQRVPLDGRELFIETVTKIVAKILVETMYVVPYS